MSQLRSHRTGRDYAAAGEDLLTSGRAEGGWQARIGAAVGYGSTELEALQVLKVKLEILALTAPQQGEQS